MTNPVGKWTPVSLESHESPREASVYDCITPPKWSYKGLGPLTMQICTCLITQLIE